MGLLSGVRLDVLENVLQLHPGSVLQVVDLGHGRFVLLEAGAAQQSSTTLIR